jgi:23S rRNA (uracil1939-C5)-methyltransferase
VETVRIERLAAGGDGVARASDGRTLFVPRTAPGDLAAVEFSVSDKARFARGRLLQLHESGPSRIDPPCAHYQLDGCGGCQLQHLSIEAQRAAKAQIVVDALARIARRQVAVPAVVPSPLDWGYRRKATFTVRASGGGFHTIEDPDALVSVTSCAITDPTVIAALCAARDAWEALPADREWRLSVRLLDGGGLGLLVEGGAAGGWSRFEAFAARVSMLSAIWWRPRDGARAVIVLDRRSSTVHDAAPAFAQVNAPLAEQLQEDVCAAVMASAPIHVIDAYAGTGVFARRLAARGVRATTIERDAIAVDVARRLDTPNVRLLEGAVEEQLARALPADVVVVNPPRTGLAPEIPPLLDAAQEVRLLVYVSCDPATLARDVARLPNWAVEQVRCYDLFPQTAHVETVMTLVPREERS